MSQKITFTPAVESNIVGRAHASESEKRSMGGETIVYTSGFGYYAPRQYAHENRASVEGYSPSKRLFVAECRRVNGKWEPTGNTTVIRVSAIKQTYLGEVTSEPAPKIATEINEEGLVRAVRKNVPEGFVAPQYHQAVTGPKGVRAVGEDLKVTTPVVFVADRLIEGYVPKFEEAAKGGYDMVAKDDTSLDLDVQNIMLFNSEYADASIADLQLDTMVSLTEEEKQMLLV